MAVWEEDTDSVCDTLAVLVGVSVRVFVADPDTVLIAEILCVPELEKVSCADCEAETVGDFEDL